MGGELDLLLLALVEDLRLGLALGLQAGNHILVLPANLVSQAAQHAELAAGAQAQRAQSTGHNLQWTHERQAIIRDPFTHRLSFPSLRSASPLQLARSTGRTTRFILSYGGGTPSKVFRRSMAAKPRFVRWGNMPPITTQNVLVSISVPRHTKQPDSPPAMHKFRCQNQGAQSTTEQASATTETNHNKLRPVKFKNKNRNSAVQTYGSFATACGPESADGKVRGEG